jgi:multiple sugar transport system substrate-binding protein
MLIKARLLKAVALFTAFSTLLVAQAQDVTTINFFHTIPPDTEAFIVSDLMPAYEAANPECKVVLRNLGIEGGDSTALINSAVAAQDDSSPSLVWLASAAMGTYVKAGVLADVQGFFDANPDILANIIPSLVTLSTYDGKITTIPMTTNNVAVYVNVTAFEEAGVAVPSQDPLETWTWEEFRAASKAVSDQGTMKGFLFSDGGGWASWLASGWLGQAGTFYIKPDYSIGFNSPEALEMYSFLKTVVDDDSILFSEPGRGWDPAPWLSQRVAMTINGPWNLSALLQVTDFDWTVVPLPRKDAESTPAAPLGGNQLYVFGRSEAADACAFKFAAYVLSDEFQIPFTIKDGSLPVTISASSSETYLEFAANTPALAGWANQTPFGVARPAMPGFDSIGDGPYGQAWAAIFVEGADIQSTMDAAAEEAALLLEEAK